MPTKKTITEVDSGEILDFGEAQGFIKHSDWELFMGLIFDGRRDISIEDMEMEYEGLSEDDEYRKVFKTTLEFMNHNKLKEMTVLENC